VEQVGADLKLQAAEVHHTAIDAAEMVAWRRFRARYRVYMGLLLFVAIAGLPLIAVPVLRHRLSARVQSLREALGPLPIKPTPAWAKVGENRHPFPAELARPVPERPQYSGVIDMSHMVYRARGGAAAVERPAQNERESPAKEEPLSSEAPPEFRQGKVEREAYDLLLKSNATVAGMVNGSNPGLRFKTWTAAKAEEDAYLVDLTFTQLSDSAELHYTWRVKLSTKEMTPLSHHARSLSKS